MALSVAWCSIQWLYSSWSGHGRNRLSNGLGLLLLFLLWMVCFHWVGFQHSVGRYRDVNAYHWRRWICGARAGNSRSIRFWASENAFEVGIEQVRVRWRLERVGQSATVREQRQVEDAACGSISRCWSQHWFDECWYLQTTETDCRTPYCRSCPALGYCRTPVPCRTL